MIDKYLLNTNHRERPIIGEFFIRVKVYKHIQNASERVWKCITLPVTRWLLHVTNEYFLIDARVELLS